MVIAKPRICSGLAYSGVRGPVAAEVEVSPGLIARVQQLGHSEIQQFGNSLGANKNIAGLEVTMDDQGTMGVGNCFANSQEQLQTLFHLKTVLAAVGVDGLPFHIFHDQKRAAVRR